jgi:hypothetical protein
MPHYNIDRRATARLPGLDVEVVHRRSPAGDRDEILISFQAVPSFGAFGSFLYAANPLVFWAEATRLTWLRSRACTDAALKRRANAPKRRL